MPRLIGAALLCLLAAAPTAAQEAEAAADTAAAPSAGGAVSPDSADEIRASLIRPPGDHPFDALDAIALPFRLAAIPLELAGDGIGAGIDLVIGAGPPPFYLVALRDAREWGLRPDVASLGPRSGPALALRVSRWRPLYLSSAVSWRGSQDHRAGLRWTGEGGAADVGFLFHRDAEPRFWGIGARSAPAMRTDFRHDRIAGRVEGAWRPAPRASVRLGAGYEENEVGGGSDGASPDIGELFDEQALFGLGERTRFFRLAPVLELDVTRRVGFQERGVRLEVSGALYRGAGPTEADFHRLGAAVDGYLPVNPRQLLALRARAELNRDDAGPGVPFTHLASLGGELGGRGYPDDRFRDRDLLTLTAEWRYEVWRELQDRLRVDGFVFFEEGAVAPRLGSLGSSDFRPSWGLGFRLEDRDGPLGRALVAFGEEGTRLGLELSTEVP